MPIESRIDTERRLVMSKVTGIVNAGDFIEHQQSLKDNPDFDPSYDHLFDWSTVEVIDVDLKDVKQMASRTIFSPSSRRAVVAPRDAMYGLSRLYEAHHEVGESNMQVFRELAEACEWLGVKHGELFFPDHDDEPSQ